MRTCDRKKKIEKNYQANLGVSVDVDFLSSLIVLDSAASDAFGVESRPERLQLVTNFLINIRCNKQISRN